MNPRDIKIPLSSILNYPNQTISQDELQTWISRFDEPLEVRSVWAQAQASATSESNLTQKDEFHIKQLVFNKIQQEYMTGGRCSWKCHKETHFGPENLLDKTLWTSLQGVVSEPTHLSGRSCRTCDRSQHDLWFGMWQDVEICGDMWSIHPQSWTSIIWQWIGEHHSKGLL